MRMKIDTKQITPATIIRTLVLLTGLINLGLTMCGRNPLPFKNQDIAEFVAYFWAGASAIWAWWKNNSFTEEAIHADKIKHAMKAQSLATDILGAAAFAPLPLGPDQEDEDDDYNEDEEPEEEEEIPMEDYDPEEDGDEEAEE